MVQVMVMKVLIADDNMEFRKRLAEMLREIQGVDVIGGSGDVPGTISAIRKLKPETVILDLQMPGGSGLDVLTAVKRARSSPTFIVLTVGTRSEYGSICTAAGADYFFEKSSELRKMAYVLKRLAAKPAAGRQMQHVH